MGELQGSHRWHAGGWGKEAVWARGGCGESGCAAVEKDDGGEEVCDCMWVWGVSFVFFLFFSFFWGGVSALLLRCVALRCVALRWGVGRCACFGTWRGLGRGGVMRRSSKIPKSKDRKQESKRERK